MKINRISTKLIKPLTPTPPNLKNYNISLIDQHQAAMNITMVLYYQSKPENDSQLEESLAKTLVQFYILAGRYIKKDNMVDCSDQGVEFIVAEALDDDLKLTEVVAKTTHADQINGLLPAHYFNDAPTDLLMSIQATYFPCGGLTIGVSISHRVFDVCSLETFTIAWSNMSNPDHKTVEQLTPHAFDLPFMFPHRDNIPSKKSHTENNNNNIVIPRFVVKRLLFNKAALTSLKSKIKSKHGKHVSGGRVVCAAIAKAMIKIDTAKHGRSRDFKIFQPVNMRERTTPPISRHACCNMSLTSLSRRVEASEAKDIGLEEIYDLIGDSVRKSVAYYADILSPNVDGREMIDKSFEEFKKLRMDPEINAIVFTDGSKFGFYEVDFGWGKPVWTCTGPRVPSMGNATVLNSNKEGDGIEVWVYLNEQDMSCFDQDEEIKLFTTNKVSKL